MVSLKKNKNTNNEQKGGVKKWGLKFI
jgi:hypothetical protein